jgi:hypothetical protein
MKATRVAENTSKRKSPMNGGIRRQIGSEANRSHLRALPIFKVERALPQNLAALLARMDEAEDKRPPRRDH